MKTKLLFIAMMAMASIVNAQQNLIVNSSFNDTPNLAVVATTAQFGTSSFVNANNDKWMVVSNATGYTLNIDPSGANSSTNSFKIFNAGKPVTSLATVTKYVYATKAVQGGGDYTFSFWSVSNKGPLTSRLRVIYYAPTDVALTNPITVSKTYFNMGAYNTSSFSQYTSPSVTIPANYLVELIIEPYILPDDTFNAAQSTTNTNIWFDDFNFAITTTLVWSDEFNYTGAPDATKWGYEIGHIRGTELQYYTSNSSNVTVNNGSLNIIAKKELYNGYDYTSASINTKGKFGLTYGKIEARIKLPLGQGYFPAFWTLGTNIGQVPWPACGEIDIMEHLNSEGFTHGTCHWKDLNNSNASGPAVISSNIDVSQFHIYSIVWNANAITWFVDDIQFGSLNILNGINGTSELNAPHYILLNFAVGGGWPGPPNSSTIFPATMLVDYVRLYQVEQNQPQYAPTEIIETQKNDDLIIKSNGENCSVKLPRVTSEFEVSIFDLNGRSLSKKKVYNSDATDIDIRNLKSGMYIIRAKSGIDNFTKHLLKH